MQFIVGFIALSALAAYFFGIDFFIAAKWLGIIFVSLIIIYVASLLLSAFLPRERRKHAPTKDRKDSQYRAKADEYAVQPTRIGIYYRDEEGNESERIVRVISIFPAEMDQPIIYINAYCELRHAMRTFRFDRVIAAFQPDTGETIIDLQRYLQSLPPAA